MAKSPIDYFEGLDSDLDQAETKSSFQAVEVTSRDMRGQLTSALAVKQFALAGKSTLTLVSRKTGTRFTYRISGAIDPSSDVFFVSLLNGPDNEQDYKYLGRIARDVFWHGRKTPRPGDISRDAPSAKAFAWSWKAIVQGILPESLEIWHEGRCGRCNRKLTVPSSVESGFGPECINKI
jgi:Family of unknown function (DUF6011)